jgi:type I restriction enzyme, S subunit
MRAKAYPKYKNSWVEWLGEVPEHWEVKRSRFMIKMNPSKTEIADLVPDTEVSFLPMESVGEDGSLNLETTRPIAEVGTGYTYFSEGDVTFAKITPCFENGKGAIMQNLVSNCGFGTTELTVLRPSEKVDNEFLHYITTSREFRKNGEAWMYGAGGQKRVPDDFVRNFYFSWPSLPEQQSIAAFLDRETGQIDTLIDKKQRIVELLREKRMALISRAVTKGLNPNARMKPSGVEWLGEVPKHWEVKRVKYKATINDEALPETTAPDYEMLYVDISSVDPVNGIVQKDPMVFEEAPSRARRIMRDGDTIVSTVRTYLRAIASIKNPEKNLTVSTGFAVIRPRKISSDYLANALHAPSFIEEVVSRSVGVSYPAINASEIGLIKIPVPPLSEQQTISSFLDRETAKIDKLISKVEEAILRLKEYRTAIISAAVTGKIDVREAASD